MRVGIGCTTYNRPECLAKWKKQVAKHTNMDNVLIYIADDSQERKGVAFRKNECLRSLKDCDYVFLFDDDCYPVEDGWVDYFIQHAKGEHCLFMDSKRHAVIAKKSDTFHYYADCGGVFMFLTKEHIERVGAFNEEFSPWGFEHAEYSQRIYGKPNYYLELRGTKYYLFAEDYNNPNHKSSISSAEREKYVRKNWDKYFNNKKKIVYLPL